jgi:diguanylate cyclase (GGDEF)-like protein
MDRDGEIVSDPAGGALVCPPALACGDEAARLAALDRYDVLDTPAEEAFDRVTRLAARIFRTPMASVTLIDGHRQWFKSRQGHETDETAREPAFCSLTLRRGEPVVVPDASVDPVFADNPFVTGEPHVRFYAGAPLKTADGHVLGALCVVDRVARADFGASETAMLADLAEIVMDELELRRLASVDALTGALSRRAFRDEGRRALHLAARHEHPLSLIAIDLDHFKGVNDAHGHAVGDAVLKRSVAACLGQLRTSDVLGRLGGEEFAALLPHAGAAAALDVAERLRQAIGAELYGSGGGVFRVSASLGVVTRTRGVTDIDALLREADAALYMAKAQGRDRCVPARPMEPAPEAARRRVLKGGRILFNRRMASRDCTIRSLGDLGAGLEVSSALGLPDTFELSIEADAVVRPCRVVGVSDRRLEVEFA